MKDEEQVWKYQRKQVDRKGLILKKKILEWKVDGKKDMELPILLLFKSLLKFYVTILCPNYCTVRALY